MKPAPFAYVAPHELAEALDVLAQEGSEASVLAGGQSLLPLMATRERRPGVLVDVNSVADFPRPDGPRHGWYVGALDRQADHERSAEAPLLAAALSHVGHPQTRHRGTVCGSVAHADPLAEIPLALLVANGSVEIGSTGSSRTVPVEDFLDEAFRPALAAGELVTGCWWPRTADGAVHSFVEFQHGATLGAAACVVEPRAEGLWSLRIGVAGFADRARVAVGEIDGGDTHAAADIVDQLVRSGPVLETHDVDAVYRAALLGELARRAISDCAGRVS